MTDIERGYVRISRGQMHYRFLPGTGVPLLMLHQTASSGVMFEAMMRRMAGTRPMYAIDTPGFGGSFDLPHDELPPLGQYRDWAWEAADALGLGELHLLGHHTGGCIAVDMAAHRPAPVRSLTVMGPVYLGPEERRKWGSKKLSVPPEASGAYLEETWELLASLEGPERLALRHREMTNYLRAWRAREQAYSAVWGSDQPSLYAQIKCPMLIMSAPDDVLMQCFEQMQSTIAAARYVVIEGGNFEPDLDTEGCCAGVETFLKDVEQS